MTKAAKEAQEAQTEEKELVESAGLGEQPPDAKMYEVRNSVELLKCSLTEAEQRTLSGEMARAVEKIAASQDSLKAIVSEFKARIADHESTMRKAATLIRQGYEYRETDIKVRKDWRNGTVSKCRLDTGEVYDEQPMTGDERQQRLPLKEGS